LSIILALTVNGKSVSISSGSGALSAIDTGTTLIAGPSDAVDAFWAQVDGAVALTGANQGFYAFPCSTNLEVTISFGGSSWPIHPNDMNFGSLNSSSTLAERSTEMCMGSIFDFGEATGTGTGSGGPAWIIGDTFLKNVYSVFRANPPSVGFASLSSQASCK
jgi:cathepsin D